MWTHPSLVPDTASRLFPSPLDDRSDQPDTIRHGPAARCRAARARLRAGRCETRDVLSDGARPRHAHAVLAHFGVVFIDHLVESESVLEARAAAALPPHLWRRPGQRVRLATWHNGLRNWQRPNRVPLLTQVRLGKQGSGNLPVRETHLRATS